MRTLFGILIGGFLGGLAGGLTSVLGGAIVGGAIAWFAGQLRGTRFESDPVITQAEPDRLGQLERKAQYLYDQLQLALKRIEQLEAASGKGAMDRAAQVPPSGEPGERTPGASGESLTGDDAGERGYATGLTHAGAAAARSATAPAFAAEALSPEALAGDVSTAVEGAISTAATLSSASSNPPVSSASAAALAAWTDQLPEEDAAASSAPARPTAGGEIPRAGKAPAEPGVFDTLLSAVRKWFMGGNTVVRAGIVILFFGLAFLLKYAYDHTRVPPELRVSGVALGGIVLLALGWRLRGARAGYAQALQGGGVGVLYLAIFAAFRLYGLLPASAAFALMACIAALSAVLAVMQNAQALALLGASGGFLAPILASTGEGSHVALFSYYVLLNSGLLAIAWYKAWRVLNWAGFVFTFGIGMLWGSRYYQAEFFATTQPFLLVFFALYLAMSVLFALRQAPRLQHTLDGTLIFGLPVVGFGMQTRLVAHFEFGAAISALVLAFVYLLLARMLYKRHRDDLKALVEVFLALGVVFATLAIPLALDGRWTSAAWALEGAALLWLGMRQERLLARLFGMLLQGGAAVAFASRFDFAPIATPVVNSAFLGALFLSVAGLFSNWAMSRNPAVLRAFERPIAVVVFWWGVWWWAVAGVGEIDRHVRSQASGHAVLLFTALSGTAFSWLRARLDWALARYPLLLLLPVAVLVLAFGLADNIGHPLAHLGWLAWPVLFAAHLHLLKGNEDAIARCAPALHVLGLWLLAVVGAWELAWWIQHWVRSDSVWDPIALMLVPGLLVWLLAARGERQSWPVAANLRTYVLHGGAPLVIFLALWLLYSTVAHTGDPAPLPYLPVFSPLDLAQAGVLLVALHWYRHCVRLGFLDRTRHARPFHAMLGIAAFICANGVLLRSLHHWAQVPFNFDQMLDSMLVQAAFSLFWTVLALCAMVVASRIGRRVLWMTGAGLMAVVVVKLFLVDLSAISGVERIVSFIGVGVLMLVVGYFSPVPPKPAEEGP